MIGAILAGASLAAGLASSVFGASKSAAAARQQRKLIDNQEAKNNAWYERNYYQNYIDSSEGKAALKRVENTLRRRNQQTDAQAAITGATPESVQAHEQGNAEILDNTVSNLAARSDARKDSIDAINQQNQSNITQQRMGQQQLDESAGAQLVSNGIGLVGSGLSSLGNSIDGGKNSATGAKELTSDNAIKPTVEATMPTDKLEVKPNFNNVDTSKINAPEQSFNPNYINKKRIPIQ